MPGFKRGKLAEVLHLLADRLLGQDAFPPDVEKSLTEFASDAFRFARSDCESLQALSREQSLDIAGMLAYAAHMGFAMALHRYADELGDVPELATWQKRRREGGEQGRKKLSARAAFRAQEAQRMLDQGHDLRDIALRFGVDRSTVYRWLNKPAASNGKARKR